MIKWTLNDTEISNATREEKEEEKKKTNRLKLQKSLQRVPHFVPSRLSMLSTGLDKKKKQLSSRYCLLPFLI